MGRFSVPGPIPYAPSSLSPAPELGMNIAQMMMQNANQQYAARSNMFGQLGAGIANIGGTIIAGQREARLAEAQKQENEIRKQQLAQMQMDAEDRQAFSKVVGDPSMVGEDGTPDLTKVTSALAGRPGAMKLAEGYSTLIQSGQKIKQAATEAKTKQAELYQHFTDGLADTAHSLAPIIATNHDGGIEPFGVAIMHWKQQADTLGIKAPGLDQALQEYQQASQAVKQANGDPGAINAVGQAFQKQVGPMLQSVMAGASTDLQEKWDKQKEAGIKKLAPNEKFVDLNAEGGPKVLAEGGPTPISPYQAEELKNQRATLALRSQELQGEAPTLSSAALEQAAQLYAATATLPPMGMGKQGAKVRQAIMNRAAEINPGLNLAAAKAGFGADTGSLKPLQKQRDAIGSFEETAGKNIDMFLEQAGKVVDTGSPLANTLVRQVSGKLLGSPDQAAFDAARQVAVNEVARITNNPNLSGTLSDSARKEVEAFNPANATLAQSVAVMRLLRKDMNNRTVSLDDAIATVKDRIAGAAKSGETGTPKSVPSPLQGLIKAPGTIGTGPDGKKYLSDGQGGWTPQ